MRTTSHLAHAQAVLQQAYRADNDRRQGHLQLSLCQLIALRLGIAHGQAIVAECAGRLARTVAANDEGCAPSAA